MYTGRTPCKDKGRNWGNVSQGQECQGSRAKELKAEERLGIDSALQTTERINHANAFISDFQPTEL